MRTLVITALVACTGSVDPTIQSPDPDPFDTLGAEQAGGPPRYSSRVHGCPKLRYATLGNVLRSRGVDLAAQDPVSAGKLYSDGAASLGAPNYAARVRENIDIGLATTSKMFDILIQAAPEMIASFPSLPACGGVPLFDASNHCNARGLTCLIGVPATPEHVAICNETVARAADVESGKRLAVAVIAAAAHTCE